MTAVTAPPAATGPAKAPLRQTAAAAFGALLLRDLAVFAQDPA